MESLKIFSKRLRDLRNEYGMTQKDFAGFTGCTTATLSAYENSSKNPSLEIVKNIAEKCNISIDWLCGLTDKKSRDDTINTYADFLDVLNKLEHTKLELWIEMISFPKEHRLFGCIREMPVIVFNNYETLKILEDFNAMTSLIKNCVIEEKLYDLWFSDKKKELDRPIESAQILAEMKTAKPFDYSRFEPEFAAKLKAADEEFVAKQLAESRDDNEDI